MPQWVCAFVALPRVSTSKAHLRGFALVEHEIPLVSMTVVVSSFTRNDMVAPVFVELTMVPVAVSLVTPSFCNVSAGMDMSARVFSVEEFVTSTLVELLSIEIGRCASAKMQLLDLAARVEQRRLHVDFSIQHFEIAPDARLVACNDLVATTVVAKRMAERYMNIQRQRNVALVAGDSIATVFIFAQCIVELQRGRIGCVPWAPSAISDDEIVIEAYLH